MEALLAAIDIDTILACLALVVSAIVGISQLVGARHRHWHERVDETAEMVKAPAERDAVIVGSAEQAVAVMKSAMEEAFAEAARLRRENEKLRKEVARDA